VEVRRHLPPGQVLQVGERDGQRLRSSAFDADLRMSRDGRCRLLQVRTEAGEAVDAVLAGWQLPALIRRRARAWMLARRLLHG
jgi:hypothetical protein